MKLINWFFYNTRNEAYGFGLIEVMLAVSITGGLALTIAKMMDNTSQSTKQLEAKSETIYLKGNISTILSNQAACNFTFGPLITQSNLTTLNSDPSSSVSVPNIKDKENTISYSTASTNIAPLRIVEIRLTGFNSATGVANLVVDMNFRRSSSITQAVKPISIVLNFNIDNSIPTAPVLLSCSTVNVSGGGEWLLTGNAGTDPASDYLGTSDSQPLIFKVNAQPAGMITQNGSVSLGIDSSSTSTTGVDNVAIGSSALRSNTAGRSNIAIGRGALRNSATGNFIVAIGDFALNSAIGPGQTDNIAVGASALQNTTTSTGNTAIGPASQRMNTTGVDNTSLGKWTLANNTTGVNNVAVGVSALIGSTGDNNVGLGAHALSSNTVGNNNVAIGRFALQGNSLGTDNVAVGGWAGIRALSGSNNIFLGSGAGPGNHMTGSPIITGNNNIFIGHQNGLPVNAATLSNQFYLTNPLGNTPLMRGDFSTGEIWLSRSGGNLYHGRYSPGGMMGVTYVGRVVLSDSTTTTGAFATMPNDSFYARFAGGYRFYTSTNLSNYVFLNANDTSWRSSSDRNRKHDIQEINLESHLEKIAKLPVYFWKYKEQDIPHMGPMAQDFWRIFGLGDGDDKSISTQDMDGVLITATKGLEERTRVLKTENLKLKKKLQTLEARIQNLEKNLMRE